MPTSRSGFATFSLEHLALGLLIAEPKHGYQLYQEYTELFYPIWKVGRSKFYAVLNSLQADGYLASTIEYQTDRPPRHVHHITAAGRAEFWDWLYRPVTPMRAVRVEFIAKLRFFDLLALSDAARLIDAQVAACEAACAEWEQSATRHNQESSDSILKLLYDFRRKQAAFMIEWLRECKEQLVSA